MKDRCSKPSYHASNFVSDDNKYYRVSISNQNAPPPYKISNGSRTKVIPQPYNRRKTTISGQGSSAVLDEFSGVEKPISKTSSTFQSLSSNKNVERKNHSSEKDWKPSLRQ